MVVRPHSYGPSATHILTIWQAIIQPLRNEGFVTAILHAQSAHAPIQMTPIYAHQLCSSRNVSFCFFEFSLNKFTMVGFRSFFEGRKSVGSCRGLLFPMRREVCC